MPTLYALAALVLALALFGAPDVEHASPHLAAVAGATGR